MTETAIILRVLAEALRQNRRQHTTTIRSVRFWPSRRRKAVVTLLSAAPLPDYRIAISILADTLTMELDSSDWRKGGKHVVYQVPLSQPDFWGCCQRLLLERFGINAPDLEQQVTKAQAKVMRKLSPAEPKRG